jgi:hypothetical protein
MTRLSRKRNRSGTTIIEFVLVTALVLVPLLMGSLIIGFNLIRAIQANQVNRDSGHMFARGVDFSTTTGAGNRAVLTYMAPRLAFSPPTGVVILAAIQYVGPNTCDQCPNEYHAVFLQQLMIGNPALLNSYFGTVQAGSMKTDGTGTVKNPYTDTSVQADAILSVIPIVDGVSMSDGEVAYVSETYFSSTDFDIAGYLAPSGVYCRAIF